jgi:structural maintenance of chromosome 4
MKPKGSTEHEDGLLEYLEDIIGTSQYKAQIEEAFTRMEEAQEQRTEKLNRVRLIEKEKDALSSKKKEAVDYLKLQNEYTQAQSMMFQYYVWKCFKKDEEIKQNIVCVISLSLCRNQCWRLIQQEVNDKIEAEKAKNADDLKLLDELQANYEEREKDYEVGQRWNICYIFIYRCHRNSDKPLVKLQKSWLHTRRRPLVLRNAASTQTPKLRSWRKLSMM